MSDQPRPLSERIREHAWAARPADGELEAWAAEVAALEARAADPGSTVMVFEHHGEGMLVDPATGERHVWYKNAEAALAVHRSQQSRAAEAARKQD